MRTLVGTPDPEGEGRRLPLAHVLRARVTRITKQEVRREQLAAPGRLTESDMVRILIEEALAERARRRR